MKIMQDSLFGLRKACDTPNEMLFLAKVISSEDFGGADVND